LGETIIPARSVSAASSGTRGWERCRRTVRSLTTSTVLISPISDFRNEPGVVRCRSMLNFTASPFSGSPSWNFTPGRSLMRRDL
jgi:hypothetical protein